MNKGSEQYYKQALHICKLNLSEQDGSDVFETASCFFQMGTLLSELGEVGGAIRCFNDAFLMRDTSDSVPTSLHYKEFHDIQMASYILGKREKSIVSYAEGDMVHDLIKSRWLELLDEVEESQFPFVCEDFRSWFQTVKIDFPYSMSEMIDINELFFN